MSRLKQHHNAQTRLLVLDAARHLISENPVAEISLRAIAERAGMSERTIYRHFETRNDLLDALAAHCVEHLAAPPPPTDLAAIRAFPRLLFGRLEEERGLAQAMLDTELFDRVIALNAPRRLAAIEAVLLEAFPTAPAARLQRAAPALQYLMSASTWRYFRSQSQLTLEAATAVVEQAMAAILADVQRAD